MSLKTLKRPAMIFIPFLAGMFFPEVHILNDAPFHFVRWALTIMVFLSSLKIRLRELAPKREHFYLIGLNILMGVIPYLLLRAVVPGNPQLALAAFFVGITPTATAAPVVLSFLHCRVGFGLTGFALSNIFIALSLLFLLPWVTGDYSCAFLMNVAKTLGQVIAFPMIAASLIRKLYPKAETWPKKLKDFSFSLWSVTLFILAAIARNYFIEHPHVSIWNVVFIAAISAVICAFNFFLGKVIAPRRYKRECSQLLGQKNTTFTLYLALHYATALVSLGPIFYIFCHNAWNAWQMYAYDRRKAIRAARKDHQDSQQR